MRILEEVYRVEEVTEVTGNLEEYLTQWDEVEMTYALLILPLLLDLQFTIILVYNTENKKKKLKRK